MTILSGPMLDRWIALCGRISKGQAARSLAHRLESLYNTPPRAYHSLDHIAACLHLLDEHTAMAQQPDAVEFALWLHDCTYEPRAKDNEARSAVEAASMLNDLGAGSLKGPITTLVMATAHSGTPLSGDEAMIADIDLAILGANRDEYATYAAAIREEYAFAPDALYRPGRSAVLRAFLDRTRIFHTEQFRTRYESAARANIQAELHSLS